MEQIEKFVDEIMLEKAKATNKDSMGALVDLVLEKLKNMAAGLYDPEAITKLKAKHAEDIQVLVNKASKELAALHAEYKEQLADQDEENEGLRKQLDEAQEMAREAIEEFNAISRSKTSSHLEADVEGVKVKINYGVDVKGIYYTAEEMVENTSLLAHLIAIGSGSITLIEE